MAFEDERPSEPLLAFGGEGDGNLVPDVFFTFDCRKKFETSFQTPAMTKGGVQTTNMLISNVLEG